MRWRAMMQCLVCVRPCVGEEFRDLEDIDISFWTSICEIIGIEGGTEYDFDAFQNCHICDACFGIVRKSQEVWKRLKQLQSEFDELGTKLKKSLESSLPTEDHLLKTSEDVNKHFRRVRKLLTSKCIKTKHTNVVEVPDFWEDEITVEYEDYGDIDEPNGSITEDDSCLSNQDSIQEYIRTDENCNIASPQDQEIQPATPADGTETSPITYTVRGFVLKDCEVRVERLSEKFISEAVSRSNNGGSIISASEKDDKRTCRNGGEKKGLDTPEVQKSSTAAKQYKCRGCDQVFEHFFNLTKHQKITRTPNKLSGEHKCDICEDRYDSMCGLRFHYKKKHAGVKRKNVRNRREGRYKCKSCDEVFESDFDLSEHHKITRTPNNLTGEHKCDTCEERYDRMCGLRYHYSKKHAGGGQNCKPRCQTCLESFESWPLLFEHKKTCSRPTGTQKEEKCTVCGRSSKNLREHMRIHGDKKHFCDICGKGFLKTHELKLHLTTHSKEKPHTCELCGKGVASMKSHLKTCLEHRAESETKNFVCAHCGKAFVLEASLKRHEFWEHLSLDRFECDVCHKKFRSKCFLQMHRRRIHFPEERIPCSMCSASFVRKCDLKWHIESDHLGNLFKCSVCNMEFKTRASLKKHELLHKFGKRYECQVCGKKFGTTDHLKRHEATHDRQSKKLVTKVTRPAVHVD